MKKMLQNKAHILIGLALVLSTISARSQSHNGIIRCGHDLLDSIHSIHHPKSNINRTEFEKQIEQALQKNNKKTTVLSSTEIINIPVVVHVIHDNISETIGGPLNSNISDEQIYSQIAVLNEDFRRLNADTTNTPAIFKPVAADSYIEFCMATRDPDGAPTNGITRTYTTQGPFDINDADELADIMGWPTEDYLNIWVCELSGGLLGYAQFPDESGLNGLSSFNGSPNTDGVVIHHQNFGNRIGTSIGSSPYTYGRTTTHEVGHWLGLLHIWGSSGCFATDHIDDTPNADVENYNCPTGNVSCLSQDMVENYMDYTDDQCMNIFTQDQAARMRAVFEVSPRRIALLSSAGCCGAGLSYKLPFSETFETNQWIESIGWDTINIDNDEGWEQVAYGAYGSSTGSISFENNSGNNGNIDHLISPVIDFRKAEFPILEFDYAYSSNGSPITDSIIISYESGCDNSWVNLITLTGTDLITSTSLGSPFFPTNNDWNTFSMQFNELAGLPVVKFRITNYSKGVNNVYFDNINIYKTKQNLDVCLYPNPAYNELTMDISFENDQEIEVEIYTYIGQQILSEKRLASKSRLLKFDTSTLTNGMYLARVKVGDQLVTKKFIIENP